MEEDADEGGVEGEFDAGWEIIQEWDKESKEGFKDYHDECLDEQEEANHGYSASIFAGRFGHWGQEEFKEPWRWVQGDLSVVVERLFKKYNWDIWKEWFSGLHGVAV